MRRVKGIELDGSNVEITFAKTIIAALAINYGDNLQIEEIREIGKQTIEATTDGAYQVEDGSVKLRASEFRGHLMPLLPNDGMGLVRVAAVVSFYHEQLGGDSDQLLDLRFIGIKQAIEASAKGLDVELKLKYRQILWTQQRISINKRKATVPLGAVRL